MLVREGHASGGSLTASTVTATYFIGARGPEYRRDDTQTEVDSQGRTVTKARWYVYDGLGSVVGEVDASGNLTSSPKYDVYGAVRANGGTATSKQGFVGSLGHVSDDTGLVYMRARYYDPSLGRFNSEDSKQSGNNWFTYCSNNPTNQVDKDGHDDVTSQWKAGDAFVAALLFVGAWNLVKSGWASVKTSYATFREGQALYLSGSLMMDSGTLPGLLIGFGQAFTGIVGELAGAVGMIAGVGQMVIGLELMSVCAFIVLNDNDVGTADAEFYSHVPSSS